MILTGKKVKRRGEVLAASRERRSLRYRFATLTAASIYSDARFQLTANKSGTAGFQERTVLVGTRHSLTASFIGFSVFTGLEEMGELGNFMVEGTLESWVGGR